jgi:hypothetical protein
MPKTTSKELAFAKYVTKKEIANMEVFGKKLGSEDVRKTYERSITFYRERGHLLGEVPRKIPV